MNMRINCQSPMRPRPNSQQVSRRWFLNDCKVGLGAMALSQLMASSSLADPSSNHPLAPRQPHLPVRAKRAIYLFMAGGPSHLEMFDNKPKLD